MRLSVHRGDGSLWMVALWYHFQVGAFVCVTPADTALVGFLRNDSAVAFDVSTNRLPYRGVRGRGRAALSPDGDKRTLRVLVDRYLGDRQSSLAERLLTEAANLTRIRIRPNEMYSWDYTD